MIKNFEIVPLPLLKDVSGRFHQCIEIIIIVDVPVQAKYSLKVLSGSEEREFCLGVMDSDENRREIFLPEIKSEESAEFLVFGNDEKIVKNVLRKPVRKWTIYLLLHSHTDLGFTAPVSDVAQIHNDNTDIAILYCKETEHWPEGSRFKWNCEISWQVQNYLRDRNPAQIEKLMEQIRKKNIEVGAFYSGELTELLGHEQALRTFYYVALLRRKYNIDIDTALLCDVPGCTKGFVQIMAKSGIKNFILADNNFIAPFLSRTDLPRPFYWKGYDNTKVLAWYTDHPFYAYIEGQNYGLSDSCSEVRKKLPAKLIELEANNYPYSEFQLQYAFDNFRIEFRPAAIVREWNEKWAYPKIKLATAGEFLNEMRKKYEEKIPNISGDWTNWWSGIIPGFPYEAAESRRVHNTIPLMESYSSILKIHNSEITYPAEKIEKIYDNLLSFDEHSGTGMVWESKSDEQQNIALKEGYGFIHDAVIELGNIENIVKENLPGLIENKSESDMIAVFNFNNQLQSGEVKIDHKMRKNISIKDRITGELICCNYADEKIKFFAEEIPPFGYKLFEILDEEKNITKKGVDVFENDLIISLENFYYKIKVEKKSGRIVSLFNKIISEELISEEINFPVIYETHPTTKIEMGKYIPEIYNGEPVPGSSKNLNEFTDIKVEIAEDNLYGKVINIFYTITDKHFLNQKIFFAAETLRIENTFNVKLLGDRKFLNDFLISAGLIYFKFAFRVSDARFRYETPCAVLEPVNEQFNGACKDYYTVQDWVQIFNKKTVINFSSIDAALIDPGEIALQKYRNNFPPNPETFFVRAVSLSEISGKIKSPYTDYPDLKIRFVLSSNHANENFIEGEKLPSVMPAIKLGTESNKNFISCIIPANSGGVFNGNSNSFITISPDHVHLMTFKRAENGTGFVLRIREVAGVKAETEIIFHNKKLQRVFSAMITEEDLTELTHDGKKIKASQSPFSISTFRVIFV
jgi:alpha-mannosidase